MTILVKEMVRTVVPVIGGSPATSSYNSTTTVIQNTSSTGPNATWTPAVPGSNAGSNQPDSTKSIRLATSSETYLILDTLFPGYYQINSLPHTYGPFYTYTKNVIFGTPAYTWSDGRYAAYWSGSAGIGFYIFTGYDVNNYPTQSINVAPVEQTYVNRNEYLQNPDATSEIYKYVIERAEREVEEYTIKYGADAPETQAKKQDLADLKRLQKDTVDEIYGIPEGPNIFGTGYDTLTTDASSGIPYFIQPSSASTVEVTTHTSMPAVAESPAIQLQTWQINMITNRGWNTWARSINPLLPGNYLLFAMPQSIDSGCLAIGPKNMEGLGIARFSNSIIVDKDGAKAHEYGVVVQSMNSAHSGLSALRIYRHTDGSIAYVVTTGTETFVHTSSSPYPLATPLYIYGYLYASGDQVSSASFVTGEVNYGSV